MAHRPTSKPKGLPGGNARDAHYPRVFAASIRVPYSRRSLQALATLKEVR